MKEHVSQFIENMKKARRVFGSDVSESVIATATLQGKKIPDRVGGHDYNRGRDALVGTIGAGLAADRHGNNQADQWLRFKTEVGTLDARADDLIRERDMLYAVQAKEVRENLEKAKKRSNSLKHSPAEQEAAQAKKDEEKAVKKQQKHLNWITKEKEKNAAITKDNAINQHTARKGSPPRW